MHTGVPLLLGSLYGSDMLAAALAAVATPAPAAAAQPTQLVLGDQSQDVTMQRFRALADGLGQLKQLLASLLSGAAHAEVGEPA